MENNNYVSMGGAVIKSFYSGGFLYQVREYKDNLDTLYKIWQIDEDSPDVENELVYIIYRKSNIDAFVMNILDGNSDYDLNL